MSRSYHHLEKEKTLHMTQDKKTTTTQRAEQSPSHLLDSRSSCAGNELLINLSSMISKPNPDSLYAVMETCLLWRRQCLQLDGQAQIHQQCVKDGLLLLCLFCKLASKSAEKLIEPRCPRMLSHITTRQVEVGGEQRSSVC